MIDPQQREFTSGGRESNSTKWNADIIEGDEGGKGFSIGEVECRRGDSLLVVCRRKMG